MIQFAVIFLLAGLGYLISGGGTVTNSDGQTVPEFNQWDTMIQKYANIYGIDWTWVKAIMLNESNLGRAPSVVRGLNDPTNIEASKSSDGKSWGLMQLTLPTARQFESSVTEVGLNDPEISIRIACEYIAWLYKRNYGNFSQQEFVIRAYNGGPGFASTAAGQRDTPVYYQRFLAHLDEVQSDLQA
jgi:soluble lytic murein transglycosylase-like protein